MTTRSRWMPAPCARVILATDLSLAATVNRPDGASVVVIDQCVPGKCTAAV